MTKNLKLHGSRKQLENQYRATTNQCIRIREKTLEFLPTVLSTLSPYCVVVTVLLLLLLLYPFNGLCSRTTWVIRYQKGKNSLDLNKVRDDGVLGCRGISWTTMQTICTSLQTDNHTSSSSLNFYRPDALPDAQPTVSKH